MEIHNSLMDIHTIMDIHVCHDAIMDIHNYREETVKGCKPTPS